MFRTIITKRLVPLLTLSIIILFSGMVLPAMAMEPAVSFAGGDGSAGNPYQIANAEQFMFMTEKINSDGSYASKHYILTSDIVMPAIGAGESNHDPIATLWNYSFSGSFDGQNHSISGIKIDRPTERYQGLFYSIKSGGVVKNLRVINSSISAVAWAGGIAVYNTGTIENCSYSGYMKGGINSGDYAGSCIGGIAGINHGTINNCISTATITTGVGDWNMSNGVGGIAGDNYGIIRNCHNSGSITTPLGSSMTGGIVGHNRTEAAIGRVFNSYNSGSINAAGSVGGVVGSNRGTVQNNFNIGALASKSGTGGMPVSLGGINGGSTSGTTTNNYWLKSTAVSGLGASGGTYNSCASFLDSGGALTAVSGHTVIENKTTLVDALNAWVTASNNSSGTTTYSYWKTSGGYPVFTPAYLISVNTLHGGMTVNRTAAEGHTVSLTPTPASGYRYVPGTVQVTASVGAACAITAGEEDSYSFTMPAEPVTITASFEKIPATAPVISLQPTNANGYYGISTSLDIIASVTDDGTLSYQWYKGTNSEDRTPAENKKAGTGSHLDLPADLTVGTHYYFCVVTNTLFNGESRDTISNNVAVNIEKGTPILGTVSASPIYVGESLTHSELTKTGSVSGILSWESNTTFSSSAAEVVAATYSFTPTGVDADRYNPLTGQTINLTINTRSILSVEAQTPVLDKSFLSLQEDLDLPPVVTVYVQGTMGNETRTVPVLWTGYNANTINPQTLSGTLNLSGNTELNNLNSVNALISVTLQPLPFLELSNVTAKIKVGSTDAIECLTALVTSQFGEYAETVSSVDASGFPSSYNTATPSQEVNVRVYAKHGYTPQLRDVKVSFEVVNPDALSYTTAVIGLDATDDQNQSAANLLAYINTFNTVGANWDELAIGTTTAANTAPPYPSLPISYMDTGGIYEFSQTYLGHVLSQTVTVNSVKQAAPVLAISYAEETINTTTGMSYSISGSPFQYCIENMSIEPVFGRTVSFKTHASGYKIDSDSVEITFPPRDAAPSGLSAYIDDGENQITIEGLEALTIYEYSMDNSLFSDLTVLGTSATITVDDYHQQVYVREKHVSDIKVCSETAVVNVYYTLTFDSRGGREVAPLFAVSGATVVAPNTPTLSGYRFSGWHLNSDLTDPVVTFPYTMTGNATLYASWSKRQNEIVPKDGEIIEATGEVLTEILANGTSVTTLTLDDEALERLLVQSGSSPTVSLSLTGANIAVGQMSGRSVKNMEAKDAVLEIKTQNATYTITAAQIDIDSASAQFGSDILLEDIELRFTIAIPSDDDVKFISDIANRNGFQIVVNPIEFTITGTSGSNTVEISKFSSYVERTIAIPDGVDPSKITTGIVLHADGTFRHVPTSIVMIDGKYYAKISSLTNSIYPVIYSPVEFRDVSSHWAKDAINDMGSRMVVSGIGGGIYEPARSITRAEFAAIIVKAMGLNKNTAESAFGDVTLTDWFNGYVGTATTYGLIKGYDSTSYRPSEIITREQAMTILEKAMRITGLSGSLTDSEVSSLLAEYKDGSDVSEYAKASVAACLKADVVNGSSATTLSPKGYVTRAEVAVMVQRLLQKSGLI